MLMRVAVAKGQQKEPENKKPSPRWWENSNKWLLNIQIVTLGCQIWTTMKVLQVNEVVYYYKYRVIKPRLCSLAYW